MLIGLVGLGRQLIEERRIGLESYLRHILSHKNPIWRTSHAFLDFLAAPPVPSNASISPYRPTDRPSPLPPPPTQTFTSPLWLAEHSNLLDLSRSIRSSLSKRDALLQSGNPSGGHIAHSQAKKDLTVLVERIGSLAIGLEDISKTERVGEGELKRRNDLVVKLQDECVSLGRLIASARQPTAAGSSLSGGREGEDVGPPSAQRAALLGAAAQGHRTVRTLGGPPAGVETEETRPLDGGGLMHLQQTKINQQDSMLTQLSVRFLFLSLLAHFA